MKEILFDLAATQPNSNGKRHGGGVYGEVVFKRIVERKLPVAAFYNSSKWFNPEVSKIIKGEGIRLFDIHTNNLQDIIDSNHFELLYTPLVENYIGKVSNCKIKATVHGLRSFELPLDWYRFKYKKEFQIKRIIRFIYRKWFYENNLRKEKARWEKRIKEDYDIITVSNHSAYSIKTFFPQFLDKEIKVFYSPLQYDNNESLKTKKLPDSNRFFLLVSGNRWEKNNLRAIMAFDSLFSQGMLKDYNVVITGASSADVYSYNIKNPQKFNFKGYVDDNVLKELYRQAYCLVYPSLNEGFGYPPLEAMQYGTPVLASPFASIPEVCGDAAIYFNPFSISEIMNRVIMICKEEIYYEYFQKSKDRFEIIKDKQRTDIDKMIDYIYKG